MMKCRKIVIDHKNIKIGGDEKKVEVLKKVVSDNKNIKVGVGDKHLEVITVYSNKTVPVDQIGNISTWDKVKEGINSILSSEAASTIHLELVFPILYKIQTIVDGKLASLVLKDSSMIYFLNNNLSNDNLR